MNTSEPSPNLAQNLPQPGVKLPFAVLHHIAIPEPHFDLLVQLPGAALLLTWRIFTPPTDWPTHPPTATRMQDHRPLYMTYEGPISNGRGRVARVAAGTARLLAHNPNNMTLELLNAPNCTLTLPL